MCIVSMQREVFILKMEKARLAVVGKYAKHEITRNQYFYYINSINKALRNDKLGINKYLD